MRNWASPPSRGDRRDGDCKPSGCLVLDGGRRNACRRDGAARSLQGHKAYGGDGESCTGGLVIGALTEISRGRRPCRARLRDLHQRGQAGDAGRIRDTLARHGAVSRQTAEAMAKGVLAHCRPILRSRSPNCRPGRRHGSQARRACAFRCRLARGGFIHRERRFGDIGRTEVRRLSVLEALAMLADLAAKAQARP